MLRIDVEYATTTSKVACYALDPVAETSVAVFLFLFGFVYVMNSNDYEKKRRNFLTVFLSNSCGTL